MTDINERRHYRWHPLEDLPGDWRDLCSDGLRSLSEIWQEQHERLTGSSALNQFNLKLQRQWAIETGIIEGLYTIDRGITQILIERGIDASLIPHGATNRPVSEVLPIIKDQQNVVDGLFDFVKQDRNLATSYIKQVHQALTAHQGYVDGVDTLGNPTKSPLEKGAWKRLPNNPTRHDGSTHEYCPPEQVDSEMDRLIDMHLTHQADKVPPELEAAWLHHRFTQIHPFQDGNGRVARTLATLVFLRAGWFPLVIVNDEHRGDYIHASEEGDWGNLRPLTGLFTRLQNNAFVKALSVSENVLSEQDSFKTLISSAVDRLRTRAQEQEERKRQVFDFSGELERLAHDKVVTLASELSQQLRLLPLPQANIQVQPERSSAQNTHWFWSQVVDVARSLGYHANLRTYHAWVRLKIREERQTELVLSFHPLGQDFFGVFAVSGFIEYRTRDENNEANVEGPYPICDSIFQFSYNQELNPIKTQFEEWINKTLLTGLEQWRRQL